MIELAQDNDKQPNDERELVLRAVFDSTIGAAILKHIGPATELEQELIVRRIWADALIAFPVPKIQWGEVGKPDGENHFYDYIEGTTPFGRIRIEWKSWKDYPAYTIEETPWENDWYTGDTMDDAKEYCQTKYEQLVWSCFVPKKL